MDSLHTTDPLDWAWPEAHKYISNTSWFDPPSLFAKTMAYSLPIASGQTRLLDLGCGSGIIGLYALVEKKAAKVTFTDIQRKGVSEAWLNTGRHVASGAIDPRSVAFLPAMSFVELDRETLGALDLIAFNPPQLPRRFVSREYTEKLGTSRVLSDFRNGGEDGLDVVRAFMTWLAKLKGTRPAAVILLSSFLGRGNIWSAVERCGLTAKLLSEKAIELRPILWDAADSFNAAERKDRGLRRSKTGWTKALFTIQVT